MYAYFYWLFYVRCLPYTCLLVLFNFVKLMLFFYRTFSFLYFVVDLCLIRKMCPLCIVPFSQDVGLIGTFVMIWKLLCRIVSNSFYICILKTSTRIRIIKLYHYSYYYHYYFFLPSMIKYLYIVNTFLDIWYFQI